VQYYETNLTQISTFPPKEENISTIIVLRREILRQYEKRV
jgi:hypothetical protein